MQHTSKALRIPRVVGENLVEEHRIAVSGLVCPIHQMFEDDKLYNWTRCTMKVVPLIVPGKVAFRRLSARCLSVMVLTWSYWSLQRFFSVSSALPFYKSDSHLKQRRHAAFTPIFLLTS